MNNFIIIKQFFDMEIASEVKKLSDQLIARNKSENDLRATVKEIVAKSMIEPIDCLKKELNSANKKIDGLHADVDYLQRELLLANKKIDDLDGIKLLLMEAQNKIMLLEEKQKQYEEKRRCQYLRSI